MKRRTRSITTRSLRWSVLLTCSAAAAIAAERPPNIILILADDMGWTDSGAYGSEYYETPNVDRLSKQSMRFTQAYAHPLCSPSRASIITGQEEARHGITSAHGHLEPEPWGPQVYQEDAKPDQPFILPKSRTYLDPNSVTLADALKAAGYRTGHFGKWHLGLTQPHWPDAHGFETTFHSAPDTGPPGSTYFPPHRVHPDGHPSDKRRVGNFTDGPAGEHVSDHLARESVKFITTHKDQPFFLNLWQYSVHGPWQARKDYVEHFKNKKDPSGRHTNPVMAAMLKSMDDCVGVIVNALDDLKLADNTIVIFYSDNGGNTNSLAQKDRMDNILDHPKHVLYDAIKTYREVAGFQGPTSNAPLRMGKAFLYEGGARVPLMVRWPGKIKGGGTNDSIINNIDLYPTVLDLASVPLPTNHVLDGLSFAPVLLREEKFPRDTSFSWFPYHDAGISVRKGDWKLIRRFVENPKYYEGMVELYDLKNDLGETTNLAAKMPEKVAELGKLIDAHFEETGGLYPKPNPAYRKAIQKTKKAKSDP